jgi:peptidyl-prolyl cis-trans isomerase-like protein 2
MFIVVARMVRRVAQEHDISYFSGKYHCPVTFKEFTDYTHIVASRVSGTTSTCALHTTVVYVCLLLSGHVYSNEAIEELNVKPKNWKDLLTDQPFTKADLITIQVSRASSYQGALQ